MRKTVLIFVAAAFTQGAVAQEAAGDAAINDFVTVLLETIGVIVGGLVMALLGQLIGKERLNKLTDAGFSLEPFIDMAISAAKKRYRKTSFAKEGLDNEILDFIVTQVATYAPQLLSAAGYNIKTEKGRRALVAFIEDKIFSEEQSNDEAKATG